MNINLESLNVKIFSDGADLENMKEMAGLSYIQGLTTNPTLMRKSGVLNYKQFAIEILQEVKNKPISFEVFSDELDEIQAQAMEIASWAENVNVKIPITNSRGISTIPVIRDLARENVKLNITAILTYEQVLQVMESVEFSAPSLISIFAGRIADTGVDPLPIMEKSLKLISQNNNLELIWASPRELFNIVQANEIGCHVITATSDILTKLHLLGKNLTEYSLETVQMFRNDAIASGYTI